MVAQPHTARTPQPPEPTSRRLPFTSISARQPPKAASNAAPNAASNADNAQHGARDAPPPLPDSLRFVVRLRLWRSGRDVKPKVHSVPIEWTDAARSRLESSTDPGSAHHFLERPVAIARVTLHHSTVLGYKRKPDNSIELVRLGSSPRSVLPTCVVVVPSVLNPDFLDASTPFAPNTTSWIYRPLGSPRRKDRETPIVAVPLYAAAKTQVRFRTHHPSMNAHLHKTGHVAYALMK